MEPAGCCGHRRGSSPWLPSCRSLGNPTAGLQRSRFELGRVSVDDLLLGEGKINVLYESKPRIKPGSANQGARNPKSIELAKRDGGLAPD